MGEKRSRFSPDRWRPKGKSSAPSLPTASSSRACIPSRFDVIEKNLNEGFARTGGKKSLAGFEIAPTVAVIVGDDLEACRAPIRSSLAFYIGGMGAKEKNFYGEYIRRVGWEAEAVKIQKLFLEGKRNEAIAAVPDEMVDTLHLVGPADRIRNRFQAWKKSNVTTMIVGAMQPEAVRLMAELALS